MVKSRQFVSAFFDEITYLALFYGLFVTSLFVYSGNVVELWRGAILVGVFVLFAALRRVSTSVVVTIALHLPVLIAVGVILPFSAYSIQWLAMVILLGVYSVTYRYHVVPKSVTSFVLVSVVLFSILAIWTSVRGHWPLPLVYPPILVVIIIGRYMYMRMLQMNKSLEVVQTTSKTPVGRILAFDYKVMLLLLGSMTGLIVVLHRFITRPLVALILRLWPGMPEWYFPYGYEDNNVPPMAPQDNTFWDEIAEAFPQSTSPIFAILGAFLRIAFAGIVIGFFIALGVAIVRMAIRFWGSSYHKGEDHVVEDSMEDQREFLFPTDKLPQSVRFLGRKDEHPLRRKFRENVRVQIKKGVPVLATDTPTEIAKKATSVSHMVDAYGEVRYGD